MGEKGGAEGEKAGPLHCPVMLDMVSRHPAGNNNAAYTAAESVTVWVSLIIKE
jgi:hypothetical protein